LSLLLLLLLLLLYKTAAVCRFANHPQLAPPATHFLPLCTARHAVRKLLSSPANH
jgi:hypothetical protein